VQTRCGIIVHRFNLLSFRVVGLKQAALILLNGAFRSVLREGATRKAVTIFLLS